MRRSPCLFLLILLLGLTAPAWAEGGRPALGVLLLDEQWRWSPQRQEELEVPASPGLVTDWKELLDPVAVAHLSEAERLRLLEDPRRLLASRHAASLFRVQRLLLLGPEVNDRVTGLQVDLATGVRRQVTGPEDRGEEEERRDLVATVLSSGAPAPIPVVANPASGLFHRPGAPHLSERNPSVPMADRSLARAEGYRPCAICFPEDNRALQQDPFEVELGRYGAGLIEDRYRVSQDPADRERVNSVGRRLMEENLTADQGCRFVVLDSDEINAIAVPTGPIYVTSGMLRVLETEDELATVLSHELGHNERHHLVQQYERSQWVGILGAVVGAATRTTYWSRQAANLVAGLLTSGFSRDFELDADREAIFLSYGAGYRSEDFILVLTKLSELSQQAGRTGPDWLRSHPDEEGRIKQAQEILARLGPLEAAASDLESKGDGDLARQIRREARAWWEDPKPLTAFLAAYKKLQGGPGDPVPIELNPVVNPPGTPAPGDDAPAPGSPPAPAPAPGRAP